VDSQKSIYKLIFLHFYLSKQLRERFFKDFFRDGELLVLIIFLPCWESSDSAIERTCLLVKMKEVMEWWQEWINDGYFSSVLQLLYIAALIEIFLNKLFVETLASFERTDGELLLFLFPATEKYSFPILGKHRIWESLPRDDKRLDIAGDFAWDLGCLEWTRLKCIGILLISSFQSQQLQQQVW